MRAAFQSGSSGDWAVPDLSGAPVLKAEGQEFARSGIGLWECDLADHSLTWSNEVYDIFGLPRGACVSREETLALYCDESRVVLETLGAYAIKHRSGLGRVRVGWGKGWAGALNFG